MKKIIAALAVLLMIGGSAAAVAQPTPRKILIMGTSTTEGMGATPASSSYVNQVKAARPADTFTVIARGGTMLEHPDPAKSWIDTVIPAGNDIVIVQFGFNEWNVGVPTATWQQQATDFLARVRAANPAARILWLSTWISQYTASTPDLRAALWQEHGVATEAALRTVNGTHVDLNPSGSRREAAPYAWKAWGTPGYDGLHIRTSGHTKAAEALLAYL